MSIAFRITLIIVSVFTLLYMCKKVKQEKLQKKTTNVSEVVGEVKWISSDLADLSGTIIFDEGEDTDTTFILAVSFLYMVVKLSGMLIVKESLLWKLVEEFTVLILFQVKV